MPLNTWVETLVSVPGDGTALTAAAAASLLQGASASAGKYTFPANYFEPRKMLRVTASGRISCVVTTPGTARFDLRLGSAVVFDTQAISLNIVAKTNVGWWFDAILTCRSVGNGTSGTIFGQGVWLSEAAINTAVPSTGPGPGGNVMPFNTAPVVGTGFDSTASQQLDFFFTQTVATGSITLHEYMVQALN